MITVKWPKWNKIINEKFIPLAGSEDRINILYGSRGSSKSDMVAKKLVFNCLTHKYFKCILYRKNYNTIGESSYENLVQTIDTLGLNELFIFRKNPLTITCINGNKFIARGGDNPKSLKSIKDPTCVWYEEDVPKEEDWATISLTIRSGKADVLQEWFTINPEVEGDYRENWFWKQFFEGRTELSYRETISVQLDDKIVDYHVSVHHSVYNDNRWLPDIVRAKIEDYKRTNPYLYSVYARGLWTIKQTGGNFYKLFDRGRDTGKVQYDKDKALHISWDFNVKPYMTCTVWQGEGKNAVQIDEICLPSPLNRTSAVCREFKRRYPGHQSGLFVYGDPNGKQEDTRSEKGENDYIIILRELSEFRPSLRVFPVAPSVTMRGNFINAVFAHNEQDCSILIGESCGNSIQDYMYVKEAADGTKDKKKEKDPETNVSYEKHGHTSDANDYFLTWFFHNEYITYQNGGVKSNSRTGKNVGKNSW